MRCPYCGAETKNDVCEFCGSELPKEKAQTTINITNYYYTSEPNKVNADQAKTKEETVKKKKTPIWLWVLGWICIFPIPLTVLMLRDKKMKPTLKYGIIAITWIIYIIIAFCSNSNDRTTEPVNDTAVVEEAKPVETQEQVKSEDPIKVEYDKLQKVFLTVTFDTTEENVLQLIEENGLEYTSKDYNGTPKSNVYKIAYEEGVALQKYADDGDYVEITFSKEDGSMMYAEYFNCKEFKTAILYNYGTYWDFREEEANNKYSGYYCHKPGDSKGGITIQYNNGNSIETGYHNVSTGEEALKEIPATPILFENDEIINRFIIDYQSVSGYEMTEIAQGNIRQKCFCYAGNCYMEILDAIKAATENVSISINFGNCEQEEIMEVTRNCLKVFGATDEEIQKTIDDFTVNNDRDYMIEGYNTNSSITCTYVPTKELSKGKSAGRIDIASSTYGKY